MRRSVAFLAFVLVGCSQSQPAAAFSVSPSAGITSPASSSSPNAVANLPITRVDFSCRLPVVIATGAGDGITYQGGFLSFPDATLTPDPNGLMYSRYLEQDFATAASPILHGFGGYPFYDRGESRWVPAPAQQALPDGSAYAYATTKPQTNATKLYIVRVGSGSVRTFDITSPDLPQIADYIPNGVYAISGSALGGPGEGVWLLSPVTGAVTQSWAIHRVWTVRDGYAWVARFDPRDKTTWPPVELAPANSLVRIDLATGAETEWFYQAGTYPWLIGLDSKDRPIVLTGVNGTNEVRLIDQPGSAGQLIYSGQGPMGAIQADGDRLWFGGQDGVFLYTSSRGLQKVSPFSADPMTSSSIQPAGFCL